MVTSVRQPAVRRLALSLVAIAVTAAAFVVPGVDASPGAVEPRAVARADCGPGSRPETGVQGRVPTEDHDSGRVERGYECNAELVAHVPGTGGFKTLRYTDDNGHTCAYYDSTRFFPTDAVMQARTGFGVIVLDMTDPRHPVKTATLTSLAMLSPHESLLVHPARGLLGAVMGNAFASVGILDLYDLREDCRHPKLLSTTRSALLGHESGWSPDGRTFYATGSGGQSLTAIDISEPARPVPLFETYGVNYHGLRLSADGRRMFVANIGNDLSGGLPGAGLRVLDVSEVHDREPNPSVHVLGDLAWSGGSIPQVAQPFTRDGRHYLFEVDEFARGRTSPEDWSVGAARIIDVEDPRHPVVVSDVRLEVHQPEQRRTAYGDPGAGSPLGGYSAHYCSLPYPRDPKIAACSMIASGLRVFDISDLRHPREVAYFNRPEPGEAASAMAQPAWDVARRSVWFTDTGLGFYAVRLTNGVGKLLRR